MQCALCQSDNFEMVSKDDAKSSMELIVSLCEKCGLIQQTPIPTDEELREYYSKDYRVDYKQSYSPKPKHVLRASRTAMQRINFLTDSGVSTGTLLDIGAGGGEFTYLSGKAGFESRGIEPNIGYSEYARNEYNCNIETGELDDIEGKYDVVTIFHVLEHLPSPIEAFKKLYQLMAEKGTLLVEVPWIETNDASPHSTYFKAHISYFSVATLSSCASQYFDVINVDTSSNLKMLFKAKKTPLALEYPNAPSVNAVKLRIKQKGWVEYLFNGKGILKPLRKLAQMVIENRVRNITGKEIVDNYFLKSNIN